MSWLSSKRRLIAMENVPRSYLANLVARQKTNSVILAYLEMDFEIVICERTLKRWLQKHGIRRHDPTIAPSRVIEAIETERRGPRRYCGIRYLHFALRNNHDLLITRDQIADICAWLDPADTRSRCNAAWERRMLYCPGPNYRWCIDGYDKLEMFGIYIHGGIDEYSRSLLWLEAHMSNRLPDLIVRFFLKAVERVGVTPEYVSSDFGREADLVAACQTFFYRATDNPASHHRWNYSITNVTIEAYWRQHRQRSAQYWIDRLKSLVDRGLFDGNLADQFAVWVVFLPLINADLKAVSDYHNGHRIRSQPDRLRPSGIPEDLYWFPEQSNGRQCGRTIDRQELQGLMGSIGMQDLCIPDALPVMYRQTVDVWLRCNNVIVDFYNADAIYAQLRHFFSGIIS